METRLLFDTIKINDNYIDPIYIPQTGKIIDRNTGIILYNFIALEVSDFFSFEIVFDAYKYNNYYQPKTDGYKNKMSTRIYNLFLYLNIKSISNATENINGICQKLTYYLTILQIKKLQKKKSYYINDEQIYHFIYHRESNYMYLVSWYHFKINDNFIFDLKKNKITSYDSVHKIIFSRRGGIIETNNVRKLINDNFKIIKKSGAKTLIILPNNMSNLWPDNLKLTYDELLCLTKTDINSLKQKKIKRLIIHECHIQFMTGIKTLIDILQCKLIWIINSLPLRYYFSIEKTPKKLKINDLATITNLWLNFSVHSKKKYKTEIIKILLTEFNKYYTIVNYQTPHFSFSTIKLFMNPFEQHIHNEFHKYYTNWKNKLTDDPNNKYSISTIKKNNMIEIRIFNAIVALSMSVTDSQYTYRFFESVIKNILSKILNDDNKIKCLINFYQQINKNNPIEIAGLTQILLDLDDKTKQNNQKIINYNRYLKGNVYRSPNNNNCLICYSSDDLIKTILICGHVICLECMFNTLSKSNKCPTCNEFITIQKITVVKDSIQQYSSSIVNYFKNLRKSTIILTDLGDLYNILTNSEYKINVIDVTKSNVSNKLKKIQKLDNVIIFSAPDDIKNQHACDELSKLINFFQLFNVKPKIKKIELNI